MLSYLPVQVGDLVSQAALSQALEGLYATNLFKDLKLDIKGTVLTVDIVENPVINRVNIEGNSAISDERLMEAIDVQPSHQRWLGSQPRHVRTPRNCSGRR